ncbi:AsmA family protein [Roseicella aquatilis]|uniref:AsmA family protein n=1 Tax=Roseicella aquatilis TaxID=2527868 RepID=A0A4R4DSC6_9PROT|nr:AsmA family protein [Roseicella aquatilis]TCZ65391.1 AsmA family protein [Roseicella aquatilis]
MPRDETFPEPPPRPPAPRRRRVWPWVLGGVALLPAAAGGIAFALFDPDSLKPRLQAAVEEATGRALSLDGPIGLKLSLVPTVTAERVALANMPGGSRPQMASVQRVELQLALLPLVSGQVELRRLRLVAPDILLETDAAGRPNWVFAPRESRPAPAATPPAASSRPPAIAIGRIAIEDGRVTWRDGATGASRSLGIPALEVAADGMTGPVRGGGRLLLDGAPISVSGESGPLAGLAEPAPAQPWPLRATLAAAGATVELEAGIARPAERRGWQATLSATVPDVQALAPLLPGVALPPLRDVRARAAFAEAGAGQGAGTLTGLDVTIGPSPLDPLLPGLALGALTARQPAADAPLAIEAGGSLRGQPVALRGTTGSPWLLRGGAPMPVDLAATAAGATATVKGTVGDLRGLTGVALQLGLTVPDLAALSPLAGGRLPAVKDLAVAVALAERGGGLAQGAVLKGLRVTSSAGDVAGDLTYAAGPRPGLEGRLASQRLDLDALSPPPAPATPGAATPAPPRDGRVIPATPLPLDALRLLDADLRWSIAALRTGGVTLRDTEAHAVIAGGKGRLDPLVTSLPGGRLTLRAAADATLSPPALQLAARSDGIELAPLLAALHAPGGTSGRAELDLDLRGQGRDLRAVAATATGHLGWALTNGQVESGSGSLLGRALGDLGKEIPQLGAAAQGRIAIACGATRWRAENGIATAEALLLDGSLGRIGGGGTANLRDESLALRLQLDLRLPVPGLAQGLRIRAPLPVGGTFAHPRPDVGPALARGAAGRLAQGALQGEARDIAQELLGALGGGGANGGGVALPDCGAALAAARGGRAGPIPAPAAPAAATPTPAVPEALKQLPKELQAPAQELLRGLFGRGR